MESQESAMRKDVSSRIDDLREHAAEVLMDLIRFASVCGEEMACVRFMERLLSEHGFRPAIVPMDPAIAAHPEFTQYTIQPRWAGRGNLVADCGPDGPGRSLILNAHLDVLPAGSWAGAFEPVRDGDTILGRGAADDKGGAVAVYLAARALAGCGMPLAGRLSLHFVIDEETGGNGTLSLLCNGHTADAAIVVECTDNIICPANRGAVWFRLITHGVSTHMGEIDKGISAIDKANQAIALLREYEQWLVANYMDHPYFRDSGHRPIQLCIGMMQGGEWPSKVPDRCEVEGGIGFLPNKDIEEIKAEMQQWIQDRADEWLRDHFELRFEKLHNAAFDVPKDHPLVQAVCASAPAAGLSEQVQGWTVSCDARLYPRVAGMPVITVGPGQLVHAHSANEHVSLAEILKTAKLLAFTAMRWCGIR